MPPIIKIHIDNYKVMANVDSTFEGAFVFDNRCGISYITVDKETYSFVFEVIDMKRYLLAKISYGI